MNELFSFTMNVIFTNVFVSFNLSFSCQIAFFILTVNRFQRERERAVPPRGGPPKAEWTLSSREVFRDHSGLCHFQVVQNHAKRNL